jgi:arylsulfatase A-like enzyme/Flp pilus assembly protein TadD
MPGLPRLPLAAGALALAALAVLAVGAPFALESAAPPAAPLPARPDVVLVTIDTLRADTVGFMGNSEVETPNLDALAAAGRVFPDAHAHNVVTLPSHTNILTGLYPFQHRVRDNSGFVLGGDVPTLATLLSQAGYATGAFVGAFPLDRRFGLARGFDVYDDHYPRSADPASFVIPERRGDEVVRAALAWWRGAGAKPRFLWVHLYDPHAAYEPPEPFATRYRAHPYLGEIAAVDSFLAPLLAPLVAGRERAALVVVTGDHGESLGEHGEATHGLFAYEATLHVPLVVWGSGVPPGRDARAARHVDIVPTILDRLGLAAPRRLPGRSLLAPPEPVTSYFESLSTCLNRGWAPLRGTLSGGDKFIDLPIPELYALPVDPHERDNLAGARAAAIPDLARQLPAESAWPPAKGKTSDEETARLRSLGYATGAVAPKASYGVEDDPKRLVELDRRLHAVVDLYSRGRFEEAVAAARAVVGDRPDLAEGYEHLALALRQLEREDEAIAVLRDGMRRAAARDELTRQLGMALAESGRADEAVAVLAPLAAGDDPETLRALGSAQSDAGDQPAAAATLERARRLSPEDPSILEALGMVALRQDDPARARDLLRAALAGNERSATAWNTLGVALYSTDGPRAALGAWQRAIELEPKLWDALYNVGLVAASLGEKEVARRALGRFVAEAPGERFADDLVKARAALASLGD